MIKVRFKASKADNGQMLIPYQTAPTAGMVYMGRDFSDEVKSYMQGVTDGIQPD